MSVVICFSMSVVYFSFCLLKMATTIFSKFPFSLLFVSFLKFYLVFSIEDSFNEELYIKPLQSGHVYSYFQFTTLWKQTAEHSCM